MKSENNDTGELRPFSGEGKNKIRVGAPPIRKAWDYRFASQAEQEEQNRRIHAWFLETREVRP